MDVGLAIWGAILILLVMVILIRNKLSPIAALTLIPVAIALASGASLKEVGDFATDGVKSVSPTGAMFIFSVIFFGIMYDEGLFDSPINFIMSRTKGNIGVLFLAVLAVGIMTHLDGTMATTALITVSAFRPIFDHLKIDRRLLCLIVGQAAGIMNNLPWGGPTLRMATVLEIEDQMISLLFHPMIPSMIASLITAGILFYVLGKKQAQHIDLADFMAKEQAATEDTSEDKKSKVGINAIITIATIIVLMAGWLKPVVAFAIAVSVALIANYGFDTKKQREAIDRHAKSATMMSGVIFAAGIFTGIMNKSGMMESLATVIAENVPAGLGGMMAAIVALLGLTVGVFATSPDAFFFGLMPVMVEVGKNFGVDPLLMGRAAVFSRNAVLGISPLTPAVFLLIGLADIDIGDHIKFSYKYYLVPAIVGLIVMFLTAAL